MSILLENLKESFTNINISIFMFRLLFSTLCSTLIAFHPIEFKKKFSSSKSIKMAKAKILICLAGTVMINVIGDSLSRAFGLFGLGSFIKFRTTVKDVNDSALIFILIAIGMTIGSGLYVHATIAMIFLYLFLFVFHHSTIPFKKENKCKLYN